MIFHARVCVLLLLYHVVVAEPGRECDGEFTDLPSGASDNERLEKAIEEYFEAGEKLNAPFKRIQWLRENYFGLYELVHMVISSIVSGRPIYKTYRCREDRLQAFCQSNDLRVRDYDPVRITSDAIAQKWLKKHCWPKVIISPNGSSAWHWGKFD